MRLGITRAFGIALLVLSFLVFLLYRNGTPGIAFLALGVVLVVAGGTKDAAGA